MDSHGPCGSRKIHDTCVCLNLSCKCLCLTTFLSAPCSITLFSCSSCSSTIFCRRGALAPCSTATRLPPWWHPHSSNESPSHSKQIPKCCRLPFLKSVKLQDSVIHLWLAKSHIHLLSVYSLNISNRRQYEENTDILSSDTHSIEHEGGLTFAPVSLQGVHAVCLCLENSQSGCYFTKQFSKSISQVTEVRFVVLHN